MKFAVHRQMAVMQKLNEKFMSDEETDSEDGSALIRRSLPWRSQALNKLILKLDQAYLKKKDHSKPSKKRVEGGYSNRTQPVNSPSWAVVREEVPITSDDATSTSDAALEISDINTEDNTSVLNSSTCTASSGSDGINGDQDETSDSVEEDDDEEFNDFFQAVTGNCS